MFGLLPNRAASSRSWTVSIAARQRKAAEDAEPLQRQARALEQEAAGWRERLADLRQSEPRDEKKTAESEEKVAGLGRVARELLGRAHAIEDVVYDLKAVNPHARSDDDGRTPEELLDLIEAKGREVAEVLAALRASLRASPAAPQSEVRSGA